MPHSRRRICSAALLFALSIPAADAQSASFDVATVKPVDPSAASHFVGVQVDPGGHLKISTMPLKALIVIAFRLSWWQISGGEPWVQKDEFDLEAKAPAGSNIRTLKHGTYGIEDETLRQMLQTLLIDRFKLKFRRETQSRDVFVLKKSDKPLAMRPSREPSPDSSSDDAKNQHNFGSIGYAGARWVMTDSTMPQLAKFASDHVFRAPVLDQTGLTAAYDYRQRVPDDPPDYSDPSGSFTRFLSELGLKVERGKGTSDILVIESATRPSAN